MTENIIHLVLARLPDAPAGVRGISLFLVPRSDTSHQLKRKISLSAFLPIQSIQLSTFQEQFRPTTYPSRWKDAGRLSLLAKPAFLIARQPGSSFLLT